MKTFTIDTDNNITAYASREEASRSAGLPTFTSAEELDSLASLWPAKRLAEVWNGFAGVAPFSDLKPVSRFMDRKTGVARIWSAVQRLEAAPVAQKPAKAAPIGTEPSNGATSKTEGGSKKDTILDLIRRPGGASLAEIMAATDWQAHSVRGFISVAAKRQGLPIEAYKRADGTRAYQLTQPAQ